MELTHTFTVPAAPGRAWELLTDLDRVGSCFPGATVTAADAEEFSGTVKVKLGPVALTYAGTGKFVDRDDAGHRAVIEARGKDKRGNGTASATVTMSLTPDGDGTRAEVLTNLSITGKPAQFGRGVMQDVSDKLLGQFVACIESQFAEGAEDAGGADSGAAGARKAAPGAGATAEPGDSASPADVSAAPSPGRTPSPAPRPAPAEAQRSRSAATEVQRPRPEPAQGPGGGDAAIDLGSAVLPVLLKRYAGALAVGAAAFVVGVLVGRAGRG